GLFEGDNGVGDPYYPKMGNTGYDVQSYDVDLKYGRSGKVTTTTVIEAVADTDEGAPASGPKMAAFNLDFRGPGITGLEVEGEPALYDRAGQELKIEAPEPIADKRSFEVAVTYKGRPEQVDNPDGSKDGWTYTEDGAVGLGEPQQTPSWIPVNDHPTDKATWHFVLRTPRGVMGISNGTLDSKDRTKRQTITEWTVADPMPSYLALAGIGKYRVDVDEVHAGIPYVGAVDRSLGKQAVKNLRNHTETAHEFLEGVAGPYPFDVTGGIVDPSKLGFAMETQTRSYYPGPPNRQLVIHEVAHQWFGDSVSVERWQDIWLNEGFATYMEWLFEEQEGGETVADRFLRIYEANGPGASIWSPPPADPGGPENLFSGSVYDRGALALQILRQEIGDADFFEVVSRWPDENEFGNASTNDLYELIEDVTGEPRPDAFDDWLYEPGKPSCGFCSRSSARTPSSATGPPDAPNSGAGARRTVAGP
ncbi:MAG TPA: M1 family metallopeptidase, partial [Solirubrobacterales bacterium]|nr:M1 family metallopeptidase [Solirubrobacterales bacterium]